MKNITFHTLKLLWVAALSFRIISPNSEPTQSPATLPNKLPADVSFCIADLKFDGQSLKICELGTCTWSYFKGHEKLYGDGKIWQGMWRHLGQFRIPIWYIGDAPSSEFKKREVGYTTFTEAGGSVVDKLETLSKEIINS